MRYRVSIATEFEQVVHIEATSSEEAEQKAREMGRGSDAFWEKERWDLIPEGETTYFVEETP